MKTLKDFFDKNNLTQAEAAKKLGITQAAVSNHINGRGMNLRTAMDYNNILSVPLNLLINCKTDKE
ncbi:MAG: helix-turn-helix transcriptional regulator [Prevotella sp.]